MRAFIRLVGRFSRDESGVFAVIFGLMAIVLIAMGGAVVDYVFLEQTRNRAQIALDAAALALQPEIHTLTEAQLLTRSQALMRERIADDRVTAQVVDVNVDLVKGSLYLEATLDMPTVFVKLVGVNDLGSRIQSEATKGSLDVEVSVAVDLSNSMNNSIPNGTGGTTTKIASLKVALKELISIVVKDDQSPTYSKMALVPYSQAVNVGTYADTIRGGITQPTAITNVTWANGTAKTITGAARSANGQPITITTSAVHGFSTGDYVFITGVSGTTQVNNLIYQITVTSTTKFTLNGTTTGTFSNYASPNGGTATKCLNSLCELVVTSGNHGLAAGDYAYITGVGGMTSFMTNYTTTPNTNYTRFDNATTLDNVSYAWINNNTRTDQWRFIVWKIGAITTNTFVLPGTSRAYGKAYGTYTSGGTVACVKEGCSQFLFTNPYSGSAYSNPTNTSKRRNPISTCVTERDVHTFTDASYLTTLMGRNYPNGNSVNVTANANPCLTDIILPLTTVKGAANSTDKSTLNGVANTITASGSTGGQVGVAWAWYMLSSTFNGPWPAANKPAGPEAVNPVVKAVVIMTDGEYNSIYKRGVIAQNSTTGSGDTNSMIGENAGNGSSYEQTAALCTAMKAQGIIVYTVGLAIENTPVAIDMMARCATDQSKAYVAGSGAALRDVFRDIGDNLSQLRITH